MHFHLGLIITAHLSFLYSSPRSSYKSTQTQISCFFHFESIGHLLVQVRINILCCLINYLIEWLL